MIVYGIGRETKSEFDVAAAEEGEQEEGEHEEEGAEEDCKDRVPSSSSSSSTSTSSKIKRIH